MVIKSYNKETGERVGDCSPRFGKSWELHQEGETYILKVDGEPDEVLELTERSLYYYITKKKKKTMLVLESNQFRHWQYNQWQSGDVWQYAPYLTKLERDMLTYGNAQWSLLDTLD